MCLTVRVESDLFSPNICLFLGTGSGMSHPVVVKCAWFCTTGPLHRLMTKVTSLSSGMITNATLRTTMSANTQKVSNYCRSHAQHCFTWHIGAGDCWYYCGPNPFLLQSSVVNCVHSWIFCNSSWPFEEDTRYMHFLDFWRNRNHNKCSFCTFCRKTAGIYWNEHITCRYNM